MAGIQGNLGIVQDVRLIDGYIPVDLEEKTEAQWDPTMLINEIFSDVRPCPDYAKVSLDDLLQGDSKTEVPMSGFIEKLPSNADKPTLLKSWKKRFVRCQNCNLFYYEDNKSSRPLGIIKLASAKVALSADHTFRVTERETGTLYTFRCATQTFASDWVQAIKKEMERVEVEDVCQNSLATIILDIGSSSCRAGFVYEDAYPAVCFPTVMAYDRVTKNKDEAIYGKEALMPSVREVSVLRYPLRPSLQVKKFAVNANEIIGLIKHAFKLLGVKPSGYKLVLTLPQCVHDDEKLELLSALFEDLNCPAVYLSEQAIMALYSYHMTTGVVVDIGDRMDIVPIVDGVILETGVTRFPYGGRAVNEAMTRILAAEGYQLFSEVQQYVVKYIKERASYIADDAADQQAKCDKEPASHTETVDCRRFRMPNGILSVKVMESRFKACEGFFDPNVFGYDNIGIHHLVEKAIKSAALDNRKELGRNILLSGGSTQTKGLPKRLQAEVTALMPAGAGIQVHAHEDRHYAAFKGAAILASLEMFDSVCIWHTDWQECDQAERPSLMQRWQ